jgi:hypothetical protein
MEIELEGIKLVNITPNPDPTKGPVQLRQITKITTADKRILVEHQVPGLEGNLFQNLGRAAVKISFNGSFQGAGSKEDLTRIRQKFKDGTPCSFNADITGMSDITKVLIEEFALMETAGEPNKLTYSITLREYREPPPEPVAPPAQDGAANEWAKDKSEETVDMINQVVGKVLDENDQPKSGVSVIVSGEPGEFKVDTNEEGIYRVEKLEPGPYQVKVNDPAYEGIIREVTVKGKKGGGSGTGGA